MNPPICKLCGERHWLDEGHKITETVPGYVQEMAKGALGRESPEVAPVPKTVAVEPSRSDKTCNACNKPVTGYGKTCNACRQRAYRERSITK